MTDVTRIPFPAPLANEAERCGLIGEHPDMLRVYRLITVAAPTLASVLIIGAPGTGRTAVARCIHRNSVVSDGPWLVVHLGALSPEAAEIELFGEEEDNGAGLIRSRAGRLAQARGGTLFLEDASALSLSTQARLVAALHSPPIERRQHGDARSTEFRIIASSPRDLRHSLAAGTFREDLYFLLAVVTIPLPKLAQRGDDLLALLAHFVRQNARRAKGGGALTGISEPALRSLEAHEWTTNVDELKDLAERICSEAKGDTLHMEDLPAEFRHQPVVVPTATKSHPSLAEVEAQHIALVLRDSRGMIHRAAEILGVHRNTLTRKIRQYGIGDSNDS